jgi:NTE family protein
MFTMKKKRKTVGVALGSGGVRGLVHIGVLKTLIQHDIPIDYIAGTSAGAVVGGFYAALGDIQKIESITTSVSYKDLAWVISDAAFSSGLIKGNRMIEFLSQFIGKQTIESLPIPFAAVATDMDTAEPVIIRTGDLLSAIRASSSVPLFFQPVSTQKTYMVDGALSLPIPVSVVRDMGADIVIAVNCNGYLISPQSPEIQKKRPSSLDIAWTTIYSLQYNLAKENVKSADIVITPHVTPMQITSAIHGEHIITLGTEEAEKNITAIKNLL